MTIQYQFSGDISHLMPVEVDKLKVTLKKSVYEWYIEGQDLILDGDIDVDDYSTNADDVADDIQWLLRSQFDVDADGKTYEPCDYHTESAFAEQMHEFCRDLF